MKSVSLFTAAGLAAFLLGSDAAGLSGQILHPDNGMGNLRLL